MKIIYAKFLIKNNLINPKYRKLDEDNIKPRIKKQKKQTIIKFLVNYNQKNIYIYIYYPIM